MVKPLININGDTADTLKGQYHKIYDALYTLREALQSGAPHGRNYKDNDDLMKAREEYIEHCKQARAMYHYYEDLMIHVMDNMKERMKS